MELNKIYLGDNIEILKSFPDASIDCCITSPPYYGLRDYGTGVWVGGDPDCPHYVTRKHDSTTTGHKSMAETGATGAVGGEIYKSVCPKCGAVREDKQVGLEETPEEYIKRLVNIFREVRRVLKDEGTLWVNIGDSYNSIHTGDNVSDKQRGNRGSLDIITSNYSNKKVRSEALKSKDLIGIPWMLAFALREDGWYLRQDIIWCLSGGTYLYVKSSKGVQPMMIKDMLRLDPKTIQLWNGSHWVNVLGWGKSTDTSQKIEIELRSGERIQCTGEHKWILEDGTERLASELKEGDVLKTTRLPDDGTHIPGILTPDILWLIGLYIAEGSLSDDCIQIALNVDELPWLDRITKTVAYVGGTVTHTVNGNSLSVRIYSQVFYAILHQYIGGKTAKNKHLNNICWRLSNENLKYLITGYFDGDGYYDRRCNRIRIGFARNYDWERDLRLLANRLGATLTLKLSTSTCRSKKFPSFKGEWRWETSDHFNNKSRSEIMAIRDGKGRNYYDISVDCNNHLFALASGVLTHNCKPNPMPESVKDRCTKSHEYIFLLSKSPKYYFDYEAIQEEAICKDGLRVGKSDYSNSKYLDAKQESSETDAIDKNSNGMRNKRDVWSVIPAHYKEAHFATYPEELVFPMVMAGCPKGGVVLDPFMGSGTTAVVAKNNNRNYVGCELNEEYIKMAENRISHQQIRLF